MAFVGAIMTMVSLVDAQPVGRGGMAACRTDLATFCPNLEAGGGRRMKCLADNASKLSPDCAGVVNERAAARAAKRDGVRAADAPPAATPPPGAPPAAAAEPPAAKGPVFGAVPAGPPAKRQRPMRACRADLATLCANAVAGGGKRIACLRENQPKLSPACATAIADLRAVKQAEKGACRADAKRLCDGERGQARRQCLAQNAAQLSPECGAVIAKRATLPPKT
jgi:hypothetical protein